MQVIDLSCTAVSLLLFTCSVPAIMRLGTEFSVLTDDFPEALLVLTQMIYTDIFLHS